MKTSLARACRSVAELGELQVLDLHGLKAGAGDRRALLEKARRGELTELSITAIVFRQRPGVANGRHLRIAPAVLDAFAASYIGKPFIRDHESWSTLSRLGTITASELVQLGSEAQIKQTIHVVTPDGVIGVLDGTLDRFSIGWIPSGAILCTLHGNNPREEFCCWPGDTLKTKDGKTLTAEWEFQDPKGSEVSAVNVPAVEGTHITDVRAALAAELSLELGAGLGRGRGDHRLELVAEQLGVDAGEVYAGLVAYDQEREGLGAGDMPPREILEDVADQLGLDVADLEAWYR